ncbi:hypothetical protein LUZ61_012605 [Rhynchospora tenuis]|uniref:Jacalin-type lectin domain-containing protein n=1 Tax=Rhynchospora tenuis TaxID=198213 RepID=A0AAD6A3G0_9POAL|nr:hypothetical protein LUZ61_012605 [Rhynchospora tenuis]
MKICPAVTRVALTSPSIEGEISRQCPTAWGGIGGKPWDDGVFCGITAIYVRSDCSVINSIELLYKSWDSTEISYTHGSSRGTILHRIELEEAEHLVSIAGYYGNAEGTGAYEVIKSLTFFTNKSKFGPIGEVGRYFSTASSSSRSSKVVGFFGRSSFYLDAIGVHLSYF